jgi:hypothetical protein
MADTYQVGKDISYLDIRLSALEDRVSKLEKTGGSKVRETSKND